ncbi:Trans-2,3-enoyl-CoA reductase [Atta colombica]|uniref:Mediator of RNA polymerase II transcription subunit 20 n=1 Tax=Atta colombica TaxID=520822 RepID=A0A195BGC3_9HYME|nr:Trans-2,3-enoyl-CoA reductase [Atta colombica]
MIENRTGPQTIEFLTKRVVALGAVQVGQFLVDCETYMSVPQLGVQRTVHVLHNSEQPASVFALLESGSKVVPLIADGLFDLLMMKMTTIYTSKKQTKIESKGPRFEIGDFCVKLGSVTMSQNFKGVLVEVEYRPCVVPASAWELIREFLQGFLGSTVSNQAPQYLQVNIYFFKINFVNANTTIGEVKQELYKLKKAANVNRQSLRLDAKGKSLSDSETIKSLSLKTGGKLYYKDLGPQIGWKTVFLLEYAGPLVMYLWLYQRPWLFYGNVDTSNFHYIAKCAAGAWSIHYVKRLLETIFVHRFSHATMPLRNLFKNCSYYWLFAMYVAYHTNHPLYTAPSKFQFHIGSIIFVLCELGNLSIHLALRNLRPSGTTVRKVPMPTKNPFTALFLLVSCPNYTYEIGSWIGFTVMTSCLPAGLFTLAGAYQMTVWALGKHKAYKKEFSHYPKNRKAIIPNIKLSNYDKHVINNSVNF